jgi:hypothetical protein
LAKKKSIIDFSLHRSATRRRFANREASSGQNAATRRGARQCEKTVSKIKLFLAKTQCSAAAFRVPQARFPE